MNAKKVVRCESEIHTKRPGNILCAFDGNSIFILCQDRDCKRWTRLTLNVPGISLNLNDAGITQEAMPKGYHLTLEPAQTAVVGRE